MEALNSLVFVVVAPVATFAGKAVEGQRVVQVDIRGSDVHGKVHWYRNGKGDVFTCPAAQAAKAIKPLSGPRRA